MNKELHRQLDALIKPALAAAQKRVLARLAKRAQVDADRILRDAVRARFSDLAYEVVQQNLESFEKELVAELAARLASIGFREALTSTIKKLTEKDNQGGYGSWRFEDAIEAAMYAALERSISRSAD